VGARSKAWVCGSSLPGIGGSNPSGGMDVCCECCVLSGRGLCVGLISRSDEPYRVWCVWVWSSSLDNEDALTHWRAVAPCKGACRFCRHSREKMQLVYSYCHRSIETYFTKIWRNPQTRTTSPRCCIRYGILAEQIALNPNLAYGFRALIAGVIRN